MLAPVAVKEFYDRFGARQDGQAFYEDAALDRLFDHSAFSGSSAMAELGCGTGRYAAQLLAAAPAASYAGFDVSTTMLELARGRLAPFGARARTEQLAPGVVTLPLAPRSVDRVVSTYVLDLLPEARIAAFLAEAARVLAPEGRLCLVSLSRGRGFLASLVSSAWRLAYRLRPAAVGGCRPIELAPACAAGGWRTFHHSAVVSWGITSEVLVAGPPLPGTPSGGGVG